MKTRSIIVWLNLVFGTISYTSCKKFVQVPAPDNVLVTSSVFSNNATATAAQTTIYSQMANKGESYTMALNSGLLSDELVNYSTLNIQKEFYTNSMNAVDINNNTDLSSWNNAYNYIYQANAILNALKGNTSLDPALVKQLTGEAEFVRAFWHFYLTNCYGDVPLVTSIDYTINSLLPRTSRADVYVQIIADLKDAQNLLNSDYVDAGNNPGSIDRVRPTSWAATALLARVYLYTRDYINAEKEASKVISHTAKFGLISDLNQVFLANSKEAIWQLAIPLPNGINTVDGNGFVLLAPPGGDFANSSSISPQLMNAFETGDQRRSNWIGSYTTTDEPITTYYFPNKYKVYLSDAVTEYVMVLRLSEQYLIRAEALAMQNKLAEAMADVNLIRLTHGGLTHAFGVPASKEACVGVILHERQVELFTEWGHRWFDLIRTGNIDAVMGGPTGVCQEKGGTWAIYKQLYPIPQRERQVDHNLTQNVGY